MSCCTVVGSGPFKAQFDHAYNLYDVAAAITKEWVATKDLNPPKAAELQKRMDAKDLEFVTAVAALVEATGYDAQNDPRLVDYNTTMTKALKNPDYMGMRVLRGLLTYMDGTYVPVNRGPMDEWKR
jgi:hypothetical protein